MKRSQFISLSKGIFILICLFMLFSCGEKGKDIEIEKEDDENNENVLVPDMLIYDSVLTTVEDDHGFFFFNQQCRNKNWKTPFDYYNGNFYYRFEIMDYPSDNPFMLSLCIWFDVEGDWERWNETCTDQVAIDGKGIFTASSSPNSWWDMNGPVDFSRPESFGRFGLVLWCDEERHISDWGFAPEYCCWGEKDSYMPLKLRITIVAVAKGYTFQGWEKYVKR